MCVYACAYVFIYKCLHARNQADIRRETSHQLGVPIHFIVNQILTYLQRRVTKISQKIVSMTKVDGAPITINTHTQAPTSARIIYIQTTHARDR